MDHLSILWTNRGSTQIDSNYCINLFFYHSRIFQEVWPPLFFLYFICIFFWGLILNLKFTTSPKREKFAGVISVSILEQIGFQEMRELRIPTKKTNPIHNDVPENITFLLLDQPSGEANTTGTLINKIDEVAINAKTANWKARVILLILHSNNKWTYTIWSPYQQKKFYKVNPRRIDFTVIRYDVLLPSVFIHHGVEGTGIFLISKKGVLPNIYIYG